MKENKVKTILVSQPKPESNKSPYFSLAKKCNVKIDFRPFIHVEGLTAKEFRQQKISILSHNAVIFTSKNSMDHFFRMCEATRITVPEEMKYFCVSEAIAYYLQKYITYRKRKVFIGRQKIEDLLPVLKKNKDSKFLLPCSDILKDSIPECLAKSGFDFTKAVMYKTVCSDLSDLENVFYDILVFYSPSGIKSLYQNYPNFKQNDTRIAAFGPTTSKAVTDAGLKLNIKAPSPENPSMTMALEQYIKQVNKR
ncbi:MAG: uroporphyrinogen-III synthase [Bacteroidota bacterium]|nr:uroporphyrinogen-III synthase [Bacteroidota bacterium]